MPRNSARIIWIDKAEAVGLLSRKGMRQSNGPGCRLEIPPAAKRFLGIRGIVKTGMRSRASSKIGPSLLNVAVAFPGLLWDKCQV